MLTLPSAGQGGGSDVLERLQLYNGCRPVGLVVEVVVRDAKELGLTEKAVRRVAERRLRIARLYTDEPTATLLVKVAVLDAAFTETVSYFKQVVDSYGTAGVAITWTNSGLGLHGGKARYITSRLSEDLDEFLSEYLRVNAEACGSPRP